MAGAVLFAVLSCVFPTGNGGPACSLKNNPEPPLVSQIKLLRVLGDHDTESLEDHGPVGTDSDSHSNGTESNDAWEWTSGHPEPQMDLLDVLIEAPAGAQCCSCHRRFREGVWVVQWRLQDMSVLIMCQACTPIYSKENGFVMELYTGFIDFEWKAPAKMRFAIRAIADELWVASYDHKTDSDATQDAGSEAEEAESEADFPVKPRRVKLRCASPQP